MFSVPPGGHTTFTPVHLQTASRCSVASHHDPGVPRGPRGSVADVSQNSIGVRFRS